MCDVFQILLAISSLKIGQLNQSEIDYEKNI